MSHPRTRSRTTDANLDCAFVENALVFVVPKIGRTRAPFGPLYDPPDSACLLKGRQAGSLEYPNV